MYSRNELAVRVEILRCNIVPRTEPILVAVILNLNQLKESLCSRKDQAIAADHSCMIEHDGSQQKSMNND